MTISKILISLILIKLVSLLLAKPDDANKTNSSRKNIIFILLDDIGVSDLSYSARIHNPSVEPDIPTPHIDSLAQSGIILENYYAYSLCTPSRASILTGKYSYNIGLTSVLVPGSHSGLPSDAITLPELLLENSYHTAMVGKWHLGHAEESMTPSSRGFESYTGIYMWDCDYYTKQMYDSPWEAPMMIDWIKSYSNGTYYHYAEPRHSTDAITDESLKIIENHAIHSDEKPLFLYISYTAAHSPLQSKPEYLRKCQDLQIPHFWRRQFCGLVIDVDEAIHKVVMKTQEILGENTLIVVSSDNGGSPWFGGLNEPYRGAKTNPFDGGVRVPGFIVDLSDLNQTNRRYKSLYHVSDWLPTIASIAGIEPHKWPKEIDGIDQSYLLGINKGSKDIEPRTEMLLELYDEEDNAFGTALASYRLGDMKLIEGVVNDQAWYFHSSVDLLNSTHTNNINLFSMVDVGKFSLTRMFEGIVRYFTWSLGEGKFDSLRILMVHTILHPSYVWLEAFAKKYERGKHVWLFNMTADPYERENIAANFPDVVAAIRVKIEKIRDKSRSKQQKYWYQTDIGKWGFTHVTGDCSMNPAIHENDCKFTHSWVHVSC